MALDVSSSNLTPNNPQNENVILSIKEECHNNSDDAIIEQKHSQDQNLPIQQSPMVTTTIVFNQDAIDILLKRTGYPMMQENGQRKYGPDPEWPAQTPEPDRACEVFVGKIPRDCFEDELVPVLERIGKIYEFRLMMEYSGYNRGYGFVMYTSRDDAKKAVTELNNYEIRKGRMIGVCRSVDNCRLFVGGIPKNKRKEEILEEMRKVTDDVVNVIVYPSAHDKNKNRGFAFVQYTNHRAAAIARRKLIPARIQLFGQPIAVDWAEPEPEVDEDVMATVRVLYVRNLMLTTNEEVIKSEFERVLDKFGCVERVKKMKDFAFVHFKEREDALIAIKLMNGALIEGSSIEVSLSKPIDKTNLMRFIGGNLGPLLNATSPSPSPFMINPTLNLHQQQQLLQIANSTNELNVLLGLTQLPSSSSSSSLLHTPSSSSSSSSSSTSSTTSSSLIQSSNQILSTVLPVSSPSSTTVYPQFLTTATSPLSNQSSSPFNNFTHHANNLLTPAQITQLSLGYHHQNPMSIPLSMNQMLATANGVVATSIPNHSYPSDLNMLNVNPYQHTKQQQQHYQRGMRAPFSSSSNRASLTANMYRSSNIYNSNFISLNNGISNANIKKQPSAQELNYDLYSGIKPVPVLPLNLNTTSSTTSNANTQINNVTNKVNISSASPGSTTTSNSTNEISLMPTKILEEFCFKENLSPPIYTLHTTCGLDQDGKEISLFMYKIMVPGMFNNLQFSSQKLLRTKEEAKNDAAEFFLMQLYPPTYIQPGGALSSSLNQDQSVFYGTNQNTAHISSNNSNNHGISNNTGLTSGISSSSTTNTSNNSMETNNNLYANANRQLNDINNFNIGILHHQQQQQQLIQPQFIYDPSGQYILCQSGGGIGGWQ